MRIITSTETQIDFFKAITALQKIISSIKTDITNQSQEQKKKIFVEQENVLHNAEMLLGKRGELIKQFSKNNIISQDEKFFDEPKKSEESILQKSEQKSDQSVPKQMQVSKDRFDFIKLKMNTNKNLATTIDNKRYTLNDANELANKIAEQNIGKNNAIKAFNNLVNKTEQIAKLRSTSHKKKCQKYLIIQEKILIFKSRK